ncbi:MAG: hypothetical protein NTZ44_01535 [Candidatus Nomurabacteria bacterium]|nr:hypothetical protein [Candidatus Nomurabacteria bacterium]
MKNLFKKFKKNTSSFYENLLPIKKIIFIGSSFFVLVIAIVFYGNFFPIKYKSADADVEKINSTQNIPLESPILTIKPLDTVAYDLKINQLANYPLPKVVPIVESTSKTETKTTSKPVTIPKQVVHIWPVKTDYPNAGAILPFKRVVAYYGNLYSKKMGVLGEYPEDQMLSKLSVEVKKWELADPNTPVQPALHYIVVTAQGSPGKDGKYRFRMPDSEIDKVIKMAKKINAIVFLDIQVALSNVQTEVPLLEKYLKMPEVHLGLDPEFSMKTGKAPGKVIGTMDATDINFAINYLSKLVKDNNLTPKILIIHRFTTPMVTNYKNIKTLPEVQFVMDMDGWGGQGKKINTYKNTIQKEPVQFTGFKLFYKNDLQQEKKRLMTPEEVLKLQPQPIYIQYQ